MKIPLLQVHIVRTAMLDALIERAVIEQRQIMSGQVNRLLLTNIRLRRQLMLNKGK